MRSSPAYAGLVLDLPATTVAERAGRVLVPAAGAAAAWLLWRHGAVAGLAGLTAAGLYAIQARVWTGSRNPGLRLECGADGGLRLHGAGAAAAEATLGPRTRRIGPSVYLDLGFVAGGRRQRIRRWLTRFDVPRDVLRRWTVVLPYCGRAARS